MLTSGVNAPSPLALSKHQTSYFGQRADDTDFLEKLLKFIPLFVHATFPEEKVRAQPRVKTIRQINTSRNKMMDDRAPTRWEHVLCHTRGEVVLPCPLG